MRKVLVPTDFSDNAFNALKYACQIFKYEQSEFFIVHAYADEVYRQNTSEDRKVMNDLKETICKNSEKKLERLEVELTNHSPNPKHTYKFIPVFGILEDAINDLVNQENIDVVVMGTRGETNDKKITLGSNTLQVMKYVHCPVLAVPKNYVFQQLKNILFPTNYMVPYKRRELKLLGNMTSSFRSNVHVLYIDPIENLSLRQEDNQEFLKNCLLKSKLNFDTSQERDKATAINKYVAHKAIDMLVMVNTRHSFIEDMLYQSTIDQLGLHLKIPFMIMQNLVR